LIEQRIEFLGDARVVVEHLLRVFLGVVRDAEPGVAFCTGSLHSPMSLTIGTIRLKSRLR